MCQQVPGVGSGVAGGGGSGAGGAGTGGGGTGHGVGAGVAAGLQHLLAQSCSLVHAMDPDKVIMFPSQRGCPRS